MKLSVKSIRVGWKLKTWLFVFDVGQMRGRLRDFGRGRKSNLRETFRLGIPRNFTNLKQPYLSNNQELSGATLGGHTQNTQKATVLL